MGALDDLLASAGQPTTGDQPAQTGSALDALFAASLRRDDSLQPSPTLEPELTPAQIVARERDTAAEIRPQTFWESLAGGVPRALGQRALSGVQAIPGLAARAGGALLSTPEAMRDTAVGQTIEQASDVLSGYAERQAETEEARRWQLGQAAKGLGPAVAGGMELVGSAPEVAALPVVGLAGMGARATSRTVAAAAKRAGLKRTPSTEGFGRAKDFLARWMTSSRGLSPETVAAIESRESNVAAARIAAQAESRGLDRMISKHVADNPGGIDESALRDSVAAILAGEQPTVTVPGKISFLAKSMRREVDNLSNTLIDEGAVDEGLADVFRENLGQYLTRSYRAFDDPRWIDELKASGQWDELKGELRKIEELRDLPEDQLEGWMESMARRDSDAFGTGGGVGTIETGIYRRRKEIPKPIRELMGEYRDPALRYFRTAERLSRNVETHRMYSALREAGLREGWLSEQPTAGVSRLLAGEGTTRTPVGGMFTTDEMKAVIEGTQAVARAGFWRKFSGLAKEAKTVGSIQTQARNFQSNLLLLLANGNLATKAMPWGRAGKDLGLIRALRDLDTATGKRVMRTVDELDLPAVEALRASDLRGAWHEARRHGVVDSQIDLGDIRAMLGESDRGLPAAKGGRIRRGARATRSAARKAYQAGDAVPKLSAWRSEQAKLRWARPDLSDAEIKSRTAEIVKNTMPTYSRVPAAIEKIRQAPFIGPFVSWSAEVPRVMKNTTMQGLREIREGARLGNKRLATIGLYRLTSQQAALWTPQLVKSAARGLRQDLPDQSLEWDAKPLLAPWVNEYALLSVKGDEMKVLDIGFADPFAVIKDAGIQSIKTGRADPTVWDRAAAAVQTIADPYLQPDIGTGAALDVWRGRTATGRTVWAPQEPGIVRAAKSTVHLAKGLAPGTFNSLLRIGKGALGVSTQYGRTYDVGIETFALAGPRIYTINIPESLRFKAREFAQAKRQAGWNESVAESGNVAQRTVEGYSGTQVRRRAVESVVLASYAASRAGINRSRIARALDDGGLSKADTQSVMQGLSAYYSGRDQFSAWLDRYVSSQQQAAADRRSKR